MNSIRKRLPLALGAMLLTLAMAVSAPGRPGLNTDTPLSLFTSLADNLLQSQAGISVTNIPVFTNNTFVYTPAIHRLLQLAANITDATTNRTFTGGPNGPPYAPSVFRPTFRGDGSNVFITGFVEEGDNSTSYQVIPLLLPDDAATVDATTTNIYGVPYVIGARKGFPNFNEFTATSVSQITRKLLINKVAQGTPRSAWITNQLYIVGISNIIGIEAWNSYSNWYPRSLQIILADKLGMCLTVTNDGDPTPIFTTNLPPLFIFGTNYTLPSNSWAGFPGSASPTLNAASFQTYSTNVIFLPDLPYLQSPAGFSSNQFQPIDQPLSQIPHFLLSITNNLRFIMLDPNTGRIIDYVSFSDSDVGSTRDLTVELHLNDMLSVWATNTLSNGMNAGINNQLQISLGNLPVSLSSWNNSQLRQSTAQSMRDAINAFSSFFNNASGTTNLVIQAPFTPTAKRLQTWTWQANDPLIHHLRSDLTTPSTQNLVVTILPPSLLSISNFSNLGLVDTRYHPWNYFQNSSTDPDPTNPAIKDASIFNSDSWNFPNGQPLSIAWLGQVHRGTPWQTVYLKSGIVNLSAWQTWTGDTNPQDALLSQPTNDWRIASLLVSLLNTNSPRDLLSVNQINLTNWSSTFSNGITVLSNLSPGQFASMIMDSNSPQTAVIVNGINAVRTNQPGGYFHDLSAVLAAPELTMNSPWLNTGLGPNAVSDVAYEMIPSQILGSLRADSEASLLFAAGQLQLRFTGFDGFPYVVQASANLRDWSAIGSAIPTNGVFTLTVSDPSGGGSNQRYYRSVLGQ